MIKNKTIYLILLFIITTATNKIFANNTDKEPVEYSKAGYLSVPNSGREVFNFNLGWRFFKGSVDNAEAVDFNDSNWGIINCPHGLEYIPDQSSGCNNYQGEAWYRKHFVIGKEMKDKVIKLHFEAIMGKSKVFINGKIVAEHYGGFLPFSVDISPYIHFDKKNVVAVLADNSDDPIYPPGKPQEVLDFNYFGGIYRDVWLVTTNAVYVTNPNDVDKLAGGGVFSHVSLLPNGDAKINVKADIQNAGNSLEKIKGKVLLKNHTGEIVSTKTVSFKIQANKDYLIEEELYVKKPRLWSPWSPTLYRLEIILINNKRKVTDGVALNIGIRTIEFKGKEGLFLNNKPYPGKLIGGNRHQDHALVGFAIPNNAHWRDAKIFKASGNDIVRAAHYPADPSFMEACDALGLFYIVATPGWQFWNSDPIFEERVISDIRNMVRRDRNHPSVLMWEPILNETSYPDHFAKKVHETVHQEYPYQGAFTVCDFHAKGQKYFDVIYTHPFNNFVNKNNAKTKENLKALGFDFSKETRSTFTREWGDCVDDWNSHNSPSRAFRGWGEKAQLTQVEHYADPGYVYTSWEALYNTPAQHVGGALWHTFDHQRGYHPDPFYGGIADFYRQPKYSYYLFASQRDISEKNPPMVYIAHEMTPFSGKDVNVFTNCDAVRLIVYEKDTIVKRAKDFNLKMPHPIITFEDVFNFMDVKEKHRSRKKQEASIIAEGLIDGKVVVSHKKMPSLRPSKIELKLENNEVPLVADGSDFVRVIASVTDSEGNVKRLNESHITFEVSGEGSIIGDASIYTNPRKISWGTAPVLIRATTVPGEITVRAYIAHDGEHIPLSGKLTFSSIVSKDNYSHIEIGKENKDVRKTNEDSKHVSNQVLKDKIKTLEKELNNLKLKEVERQQRDFEGN
ncbi:glycoside hydrolase family 2 protein [Seonamhaeicola marinus]|uniref:Glycoside hydrolase family 2 protein n=2 Tax=Seonamhaeicola marinus TaxID=1912246 RepID=A0A5D0INS1_9FLAO|nr:glycoside hydrolase family 2 protein [Seonamhaeicola marinus]